MNNGIGKTRMGSLHICLVSLYNKLSGHRRSRQKNQEMKQGGVDVGGYSGDGNSQQLLTAFCETISQTYLEGLVFISKGFVNLESPYIRVALDRSRQEGKEEETMPNLVE